jgi:GTP-binding protein EngB required for normal cell division
MMAKEMSENALTKQKNKSTIETSTENPTEGGIVELTTRQPFTEQEYNKIDHTITKTSETIRWGWACRLLDDTDSKFEINIAAPHNEPIAGDVALFKVSHVGENRALVTNTNKRMRIYVGDLIVGVFGNRYATDAFEGEIEGIRNLSLLTASGMVGTLKSRHHSVGKPTSLSFVGFLQSMTGQRVNLKQIKFNKSQPKSFLKNLIIVIGSGMNSGKTTVCRKMIKALTEMGNKVAACKLTGSVSHRDQYEMTSAAAAYTIDFSDYGFPSTYKCDKQELIDLFNTMLADIEKINPDVTIMEIADGLLQRETSLLLSEPLIKESAKGIFLSADSAPSALFAVEYLKRLQYNVIGVSGVMTSSPLYTREFQMNSDIPVISSASNESKMFSILTKHFKT